MPDRVGQIVDRCRRWTRVAPVAPLGMLLLAVGAVAVWGVAGAPGFDAPTNQAALTVAAPRVVVLKSKRRLHLFDGERLVRIYRVGLGSQATGQKVMRDDGCTPEGVFRICSKNEDSPYRRFLGLGYPDVAAASRGLNAGVISRGEYDEIVSAHRDERCPSWTTALGGGIGIHGHGADADWTAGCVALTDDDIDELFSVLRLGDEVEILP